MNESFHIFTSFQTTELVLLASFKDDHCIFVFVFVFFLKVTMNLWIETYLMCFNSLQLLSL